MCKDEFKYEIKEKTDYIMSIISFFFCLFLNVKNIFEEYCFAGDLAIEKNHGNVIIKAIENYFLRYHSERTKKYFLNMLFRKH